MVAIILTVETVQSSRGILPRSQVDLQNGVMASAQNLHTPPSDFQAALGVYNAHRV